MIYLLRSIQITLIFLTLPFNPVNGVEPPKKSLRPVMRPIDWGETPINNECCTTDLINNNPVKTIPKSIWGGANVEKDPSFDCMDYPTMAPLMGYPKGLTEKEVLDRVYTGGRILIHHTANNDNAYRNQSMHIKSRGLQDLAYHFFINNEGDILEGRPLTLMGAHAGTLQKKHYHCEGNIKVAKLNHDYDFRSIGIVLQGNFEVMPISDVQYGSLRSLVHHLVTKYKISKINGHYHYRPGGTLCPGAHVLERLKADQTLKLEKPVDKTTNSLGPNFICRYPSSSCK